MITGGRTQARDEIFAVAKDAIDALAETYAVIWQDDLEDVNVDEPLFLISTQHVTGQQASLAGDTLTKRRESRGMLHIQIRVPVKQGGLTLADNLSTIIEEAYFGTSTPGGVWFTDVVGKEIPAKDGNVRTEVSAEFIYQEMT